MHNVPNARRFQSDFYTLYKRITEVQRVYKFTSSVG